MREWYESMVVSGNLERYEGAKRVVAMEEGMEENVDEDLAVREAEFIGSVEWEEDT